MITTIASFARAIGLPTLLESVETSAQFDFARTLPCDAIQGNLVTKPLPCEQVGRFIARFDDIGADRLANKSAVMPAA
jgi:EAL domain-containing protein (putative c-di-GMP-specific phosphodiesterase class I)